MKVKHWVSMVLVAVVTSLVTTFIWFTIQKQNEQVEQYPDFVYKATISDDLFSGRIQESFRSSAPTNFTVAAERSVPAVVSIRSRLGGSGFWEKHSFSQSSGSGVIISPDGYIVTNNHVVDNSTSIKVTLNDKKEYEANLVGKDPSTDLALIKISTRDLPFVPFGNSDSLSLGEWVLAVGNPFGLESTVTAGIVSAKGRSINILDGDYPIESFIQTDAVVNPGNSGGALVNSLGELIGINTAIITQTGQFEGYSFAVPSNLVQKVIYDLKEFGKVQRGLLGVAITNVNDKMAKELLLPNVSGVQVLRVSPSGSADIAGMKKNDVIVSVNGVKTNSVPQLQELVGRYRPGDVLDLEFYRAGILERTAVTLMNPEISSIAEIGFELRELTNEEKRVIGKQGVLVVSIDKGSKIDKTNMSPGFIITKVNEQPVESIAKLAELLRNTKGRVVLEGFYRKYNGEYYYTFTQ